ncbi:hypothetical protein AN958_10967 [Leucoagaricus sp. SymC.cos]|nr:hypothetical protein AN958_10967 [Leucoagaricus sp. SymC.cos]
MRSCWASLVLVSPATYSVHAQHRRNAPGSKALPSTFQWKALNDSVAGRPVHAVPSGEVCRQTNCTILDWARANWRHTILGAMNQSSITNGPHPTPTNQIIQDYDSNSPSLCGQTTPATCGQGDVPLYAILAETAEDIQAAVNFARNHDLRLSIKASSHDYLGRFTAKNSLLIHTYKIQSISFSDNYVVGNVNKGFAVTAGNGVGLSALYNASEKTGKIFVGGTATTVVTGGGYVQGAGHSALSPFLGLAADNALGALLLMRVINFEQSLILSSRTAVELRKANEASNPDRTYTIATDTIFPNATAEQAIPALAPFFADLIAGTGAVVISNTTAVGATANELLAEADDIVGGYAALSIHSHLVADRKVAQNAHIDNAVNLGWRSAKIHHSTIQQVNTALNKLKTQQPSIFETIPGLAAAAHSNEADPFEENWQSVFYGKNYDRLSAVKRKYDPSDLFVVRAGVGSERWDEDGFCRV